MTEIAVSTKSENETVTILAHKAHKDSKTMKIITFLALLYLPASLVAVRCPTLLIPTMAIHILCANNTPDSIWFQLD